jgi:hypothetical protein
MAVWAYRPEILDRVNFVLAAPFPHRLQVVHVDDSIGYFAVRRLEIKAADKAFVAVMFDAATTSLGITLVRIEDDLVLSPLDQETLFYDLSG